MSFQLWFAVRYVHVAAVTMLVGGAAVVGAICWLSRANHALQWAVLSASFYEWGFWLIAGIVVATGVSNLGLKGEGLLPAASSWGKALSGKLDAAVALLALSLVRSEFVMRCAPAMVVPDSSDPARTRGVLAVLYGLTVALLLGMLWAGLGLAHGRY